jgi:hypothetical protein
MKNFYPRFGEAPLLPRYHMCCSLVVESECSRHIAWTTLRFSSYSCNHCIFFGWYNHWMTCMHLFCKCLASCLPETLLELSEHFAVFVVSTVNYNIILSADLEFPLNNMTTNRITWPSLLTVGAQTFRHRSDSLGFMVKKLKILCVLSVYLDFLCQFLNSCFPKNAVIWDVTLSGSCKNRRFGGTYRLFRIDGSYKSNTTSHPRGSHSS